MKIVAITACPTGIAHTYLAAESLKKTGKKLGIEIFVETQGTDGTGNILTPEQIREAEYVIFAADKTVENQDRFIGKKIIEVPVSQAVKNSDNLIQDILVGKYASIKTGDNSGDADLFQLSSKQGIYKHLMTGVSWMMPFIVAGGIFIGISFAFGITSYKQGDPSFNYISLFFNTLGTVSFKLIISILAGYIAYSIGGQTALMPGMVGGYLANEYKTGFIGGILAGFIAGYVLNFLKYLFKNLPSTLSSLRPVLFYPVFGLLFTGIILLPLLSPISAFMDYIINYLNSLDSANKGYIGMLIGGMMATDMGGPINKTASLFANAALASGNPAFQSAKIAGGMVPPLAIALCTTFFPKLFSEAECKAGKACYFLGACFITEGVLPFAASDPLRVITASIIGSALAGFLTQYFNIIQMATHGGIFIIPLVSRPIIYIAIIMFGALVSALILGFLKSKKTVKL